MITTSPAEVFSSQPITTIITTSGTHSLNNDTNHVSEGTTPPCHITDFTGPIDDPNDDVVVIWVLSKFVLLSYFEN